MSGENSKALSKKLSLLAADMVQKFLQCTEIELRLRRPVFLNLVYNTFLSGLEPEQVHFTELKTCDQEMLGYMKKCYKPTPP